MTIQRGTERGMRMKREKARGFRQMISAALGAVLCAGLLLGPLAGCQKRDGIPTVDASQLTVTPPSQTDGMIPTDAQFSVGFGDGKKISAMSAGYRFLRKKFR